MSAKALSKIYYNLKYPGFLGRVYRLLKRARQLNVFNVLRHTVQNYLRSKHAYTHHKPNRVNLPETKLMWRLSMFSGRPIWLICILLLSKTFELDNFYINWWILKVWQRNPGPYTERQSSHGGVRSNPHYRQPTPPSTPTNQHWHRVLELRLSGLNKASWYPAF